MTPKFKIIFFSEVNSKFGLPFFKKICNDPHFEIVAFVTTPSGKLCSYYVGESNPVNLEKYAISHHIPVYRPKSIKTESFYSEMVKYHPDYFFIANYQKILDARLIALPKEKALNFHPSPLPRYAGLAPFFWMAKNSETNSGVSCIAISPEIDGGDLVAQLPVNLTGDETALEIRTKLFNRSLDLLDIVLNLVVTNTLKMTHQDKHKRIYFSNPSLADRSIDSQSTVEEAMATLRACSPKPAYLITGGKQIPVDFVGYTKRPQSILMHLKNGNLSFLVKSGKR